MRGDKNALIADISFVCILLLLFICTLFVAASPDYLLKNAVILAVVFAVVIATYFSSLTAGLILNMVLIFGYVTYLILFSALKGVSFTPDVYFWMVWSPCMTAATHLFTRRTLLQEKENERLRSQLVRLSGVDSLTELKNMRSYERECHVYIKISRRYKMELVLLVWQFRFQRELAQMIGPGGLERLVKQVSKVITSCLREEDAVYLLDSSPYLWGTLLFTDSDSIHVVIDRVEKQLEKIDLRDASGKRKIALDMRIGTIRYSEQIDSPFQLLEQAKKRIEYDV
ncbi:MAG: diguanylate cyclase [Ruminococcaceae bacterium]|nr:diguanylate cyclase [Oscillospiraceae bacterium]